MMNEPETKKPANKFVVGALAAVIIFTFGYTGYSLVYPPKAYLGEKDRATMEFMMAHGCAYLKEQYDALEVDGQIEWDGALAIVEECGQRVKQAQFEQVLIQEFSKHYD